ncbi:hypothetical protein EJ357_14110 [Streptomyces cyaneochromogenes]|uniref:Aromatic ring-opening dioxygenase LigA n=1 Tax=Streptomyces cyaneochromogenes TaxID=2496836 RepID=A0A3Q9ESF4_9ACTN|nr:hypothetical protein [Streptomyces cyaneochromogenes]AZQ34471.1 hypothetical protein EJ357_14110 [Streptomyces cyaneochromogenes]
MSAAHKPSAPGRIARATASAVLIVVTCVLVPVALITVWVHDIALDTDRYVDTVAPLATEPAIQDAAVHRISEAVDVRIDGDQAAAELAGWLSSQGLPPRATAAVRGLGPQIDSAVDGAVNRVVTRIVHGDAFATVWTNANERAHNAVVHALTGEGRGAVGVAGGTVTLDVGTLVEQVKKELVDAGLSPAAKIPDVDKQLVLFQSEELEKIRDGAHLLDEVGYWLPVLTVLIGVAGVLLARRRRRVLIRTALGAAFACLLVVIALVLVRRFYLDHLPAAVQSDAAAAAVFDTLLRFLKYALVTAIVLGVVVALGAYLVGPGRLPVAIRRGCDRTADKVAVWADGHEVRAGRAGVWAQTHRRSIALSALAVLAFVFAVWNRPTTVTVLVFALVLLAVLAVLALLAAGGRVEMARATREG